MNGLATAGRGSASFSGDETSQLSGQVINALRKACAPSLAQCELEWPHRRIQLGEIFKGQSVRSYEIMSMKDFENIRLKFTSAENPVTGQKIDLTFSKDSFTPTELPLF